MTQLEVIECRKSIRNFTTQPISEEKRIQIETMFEEKLYGPFGNSFRVSLLYASLENPDALRGLGGSIGTYGFIKNAQAFVVGALPSNKPFSLHDYGYLMEGVLLVAEKLGIGSCWLGGSFRPGPFGRAIAVQKNESVPAVIALGYPEKSQRFRDRLIRFHHNKGNQRADWNLRFFDHDNFDCPADPNNFGKALSMLRAVHAAPSSCNTQPWRIVRDCAERFHFFFARNQRYSQKDAFIGNADLQLIDMGIAMRHFEEVARELGQTGEWVILDDVRTVRIPPNVIYLVSWVSRENGAY